MFLALAALLLADPAPLKVGFATADITPPAGYRMAGGYTEVFAAGVHDPLFAKAIYFEQGDVTAALVVCDVCGQARDLTDAIRKQASAATGVPFAHVSVSATHTHGGPMHYDPVFIPLFRERYKATDDATDPKEIGGYRKRFVAQAVAAVVAAQKAAKPAALSVGTTTVPGVAFNRRFHMTNGTVRFNPGRNNPDIVRPAGPTDDELPVLLASADGKPVGGLTAFAMHVTAYSGKTFSADYPGHLQGLLRKEYGPDFVSVFGEGCAGDVNQVDVSNTDPLPTPEGVAAKLAVGWKKAAAGAKPVAATLAVKTGIVKAPLKPDRVAEIAAMKDKLIGKAAGGATFMDQVEAYQVLLTNHLKATYGDPMPLEVQAFRLGADAAVVILPHEVFVEIGLQIKKASPFRHTLVVTIANEVDCYVPTRKAFAEGSYEVTNSPYRAGVGELLADEAIKLLKDLK